MTGVHACPGVTVTGKCGRTVSNSYVACALDWYRLPARIRTRVWTAFANGRGVATPGHDDILVEAVEWYRNNPRQTDPPTGNNS